MSTLREAAQQALEALENCTSEYGHRCNRCDSEVDEGGRVVTALRAALAQEEQDTDCHAQGICQRSGYGIGDITPAELSAALGWPGGISTPVLDKGELLRMVAQQEQEPVAWIDDSEHPKHRLYRQSATEKRLYGPLRPLYTHPPRREWRGLTEEEREQATGWSVEHIEAALKEKNNG